MSRATVVVRPGWNEAAHIDAEILHAVAYYKFKTHVEGLLQRGLISQVIRLWSSVCQIDHFPPHLWEWRDFPFSDGHPAWKRTVGDALSIWEDSGFLGLVHGTVQLSWICPGVTRGWSGNFTMIAWARRSWICCSLNRRGPIGQRGILRRTTSSTWLSSSSTILRAWSTSSSCGMSGELGSLRPRDVYLLHGDAEVHSAVSGPARTLHILAAVVSGVVMAYHSGAYAVQAASEAPPCAETAMERVASTRVAQWRSQWGLQDNTDFAYAFASYDSAEAHGGHHVADAWLQARFSSMDEDLIPQVAAAAESSGSKDRPASWPAPKASMLKKSKMVQALRIRPGPDQPEQVLLRAEALRKAFSQAKVMRPQKELTPERYSQWQDALDTLAEL